MAPASLAAQKITSSSRLPRGLAADPPPSPTINKIASALGANSRLKSNPAPKGPSRKNSSYNFKHTDPPGTSLLTAVKPLIPPLALSPSVPGITPATPLLAAAATGFTPPVPPNLDLSEIAQPVPVRPSLRQGSSYCGSQPTPLPAIDETKVYVPGQGSRSPNHRRRRRANSGFFCTYAMDGVEDMPVLGRRRSNSGNYDEGWPLPPVHVAERGHNTPGDPRRSSMIAEGDLMEAQAPVREAEGQADIARPCAIQRMQSDVAAMLSLEAEEPRAENAETIARAERESSVESSVGSSIENIVRGLKGSGDSSTATTQPTTRESSRESSETDLGKLAPPPLQERKTGLSALTEKEEPSSAAEGSKTKYFDFSPSFNGPTSRKPSDGEGLSPHTRHNSPVEEPVPESRPSRRPELHPLTTTELIGMEEARNVDGDGYSTDNDDWHSIRSHMTRTTTAGGNSLLYNYSMATPNMALPTPEELLAQWEGQERDRSFYLRNIFQAVEGPSPDNTGTPASDTPRKGMATMGKIRSAAYPFPRLGSDRKGKGKQQGRSPNPPWERPRSSNWQRSLTDIFRGNDRKARDEREREAELAIDEQVENFHNRKVEIGPSDSDEESSPPGEWKSPWAVPEGEGAAIPNLQEGDDPFHDNFATSSSASAIPSLTSSTINFISKDKGKGKENMETPPLSARPNIPGRQVPIVSPALAKLASGSIGGSSGHNRGMVNIGLDGRPVTHRMLSAEKPKVGNWSSSDEEEEEFDASFQIMTDAGTNAQEKRSRRFMRPGLESRMSTVGDMDIRRASTVEMVRSGPTVSRVVIQESRDSRGSIDEEERLVREAKLRKINSKRKRSMAPMGRKKSVAPEVRTSHDEGGVKRRISTALQGGFGGRKMTTDGRGGIGSAADIPGEERKGIWSSILDKFRRGSEDDAIANKRKAKRPRPATGLGALAQNMSGVGVGDAAHDATRDAGLSGASTIGNVGIVVGEGEPMRKKTTSFWRRRIEADPESGRLPVLKRMQEAIKRGNGGAMLSAPVADATA